MLAAYTSCRLQVAAEAQRRGAHTFGRRVGKVLPEQQLHAEVATLIRRPSCRQGMRSLFSSAMANTAKGSWQQGRVLSVWGAQSVDVGVVAVRQASASAALLPQPQQSSRAAQADGNPAQASPGCGAR